MNIPQEYIEKANQWAHSTGADPLLLVAIARHETNFGTAGVGPKGFQLGYGAYGGSNNDHRFQGLDNQMKFAGMQIYRFMKNKPVTQQLLNDFETQSWKAGDKEWGNKVWVWYCLVKAQLAPAQQPEQHKPVYYRVVWGDTLTSISHRYGTSIQQIALWNGIRDVNRIKAGTVLRVQ